MWKLNGLIILFTLVSSALASPPQQPAETGPQRAAEGRAAAAEQKAAKLEQEEAQACTAAHADLAPQNFTATVVPSLTQNGQVTLHWAPVAGVDSYQISRRWAPAMYHGTLMAYVGPAPGPSGQAALVPAGGPITPASASTANISDLPLFYPVTFAISTTKRITANIEGASKLITCQSGVTYANAVTPVAAPNAAVWGFADTHTHQFANLGFSGYIIGQSFGDPRQAFDGDYVGHGLELGMSLHHTGGYPNFDGWPTWDTQVHQQMYDDWLYRAFLGGMKLMVMHAVGNEALCIGLHGAKGAEVAGVSGAIAGGIVGGIGGSVVVGMSAAAITNSVAAGGAGPGCDDMTLAFRQIQGANDMEAYLNSQCSQGADPPRCPKQGMGWYHIVRSAEEARATINRGQMAVILGIEVDRLLDCARTTGGDRRAGGRSCLKSDVDQGLDQLVASGVRHVFPVHLADNAFGGMALYPSAVTWNMNNHFLNGDWIDARPSCPKEIFWAYPTPPNIQLNFNENENSPEVANALAFFQGLGVQGNKTYPGVGHCNYNGLTDLGKYLISGLMSRHMIIDIDHMSLNSVNDTLSLTWQPRKDFPYPVIAGHTGFLGVANSPQAKHENAKSDNELLYIQTSGGLVAAGLNTGSTQNIHGYTTTWGAGSWRVSIPNDCSSSSKTWAQSYLYAVDHLGGPDVAGVAVATDQPLNPFLGPRFGYDGFDLTNEVVHGCGGNSEEKARQSNTPRVQYPIPVLSSVNVVQPIQLQASTLGNKTWDFNNDGMAHFGMYPDLIQDLRNLGFTARDLGPLFRSAEQYIRMWERAEQPYSPATPPVIVSAPANCLVGLGQSARFAVSASGAAPLNYQWRRNGAPIGGATSPNYVTSPVTPSDLGAQFVVVVSNSLGTITSSAATIFGQLSARVSSTAPSTSPVTDTITVTSGGAPLAGVTVTVGNSTFVTNASGVVVITHAGCFTGPVAQVGQTTAPKRTPVPCNWTGTASKNGYQTISFGLQ